MKSTPKPGLLRSLDWFTILLYIALLGMGWMSICGASFEYGQMSGFWDLLDLGTRPGMQIVWIGTSLLLGAVILSTDDRIIESFSYIIYIAFIALLVATPFLARDIKGSMSWIKIGAFSIQPAEFAKFGTALCVAKIMGTYNLNAGKWKDFLICAALILLPMGLIVFQKETGSALVYLSFFLMLYRHGMPGSLLFTAVAAVIYFVVGVRFAEDTLWDIPAISLGKSVVLFLIQLFTCGMAYIYTPLAACKHKLLAYSMGGTLLALLFGKFVLAFDIAWVQLAIGLFSIGYLLYLALRERLFNYFNIALFMLGSIAFSYSCDYVLNQVLEPHQQMRIRVLLGLEDDPRGAGYNVIQAKIAIGSGGLEGKGFLQGTQTKLKYVPEQDTDFIFCTVGEEEGFIGCTIVLSLFLLLILRLIHLAERQPYVFGRVYGYCVMSVFLFHVFINVGMVLGLTPVIGIPLPFFSYGGSSLWGFTILLFILLRIDVGRNRMKR